MKAASGTPQPGTAAPGPPASQRLHQYVQLAAVVIIVLGCYLVLHASIAALLFAAVVCSSTWPLYLRLRTLLRGRSGLAALVMTLLMILVVVGPSILLAISLTDNVAAMIESGRALMARGPIQPPVWLHDVPMVGDLLADYWRRLASGRESLAVQAAPLLAPARNFVIGLGKAVGEGLLQLVLATFVGFFFYRDGEALMTFIRKALDKLAGSLGHELIDTIASTVNGVVLGTFGTGLAQALVALIGFLIAGLPMAFLLAMATFFLSILPIGPPLVWGGATLWLVYEGQTGWAVFMGLWGVFAISSIDNLVKPYLISLSSKLPLLLTVLGVFGGVIAFGFIGLFIGPPVLAVGLTLAQLWVSRVREQAPPAKAAGTA